MSERRRVRKVEARGASEEEEVQEVRRVHMQRLRDMSPVTVLSRCRLHTEELVCSPIW